MTITREAFRDLLLADAPVAALVGARVSAWPLSQKSAMPAITYLKVSGSHDVTQDGEEATARARYQVDVYGASTLEAALAAKAVRQALNGFRGTVTGIPFQGAFVTDEDDDFEDEGGRYRVRLDVNIWTEED